MMFLDLAGVSFIKKKKLKYSNSSSLVPAGWTAGEKQFLVI